jgi:hypothetical protein
MLKVSVLMYSFLISLSGTNPSSQRQQNKTRHDQPSQQLNIECTTAEQPQLYQEQSSTSDVRIEMQHGSNDNDDA